MNAREAVALIAPAVQGWGGTWVDVGAGDGTFTRALAQLLEPRSRIFAVDTDAKALAAVRQWADREGANVTPVVADFRRPIHLPGFGEQQLLDGMLAANALHFVQDPAGVLARLVERVRPGGRVVIIEYDRRRASPWVPYPIDGDRLLEIAASAALTAPTFTATRPSMYGGAIYVAAMDRLGRQTASVRSSSFAQKPPDESAEQEIG